MSLVTIGLSVYNAEKYLYFAINSVLEQTYVNFEFIIIDDGSTDGSVEIIKSFKDDRILFISDGMNKGLPFRLNQIVELAKGDYVARMDADDIMVLERIRIQIQLMKNNPEIDVLGTNAFSIDENNNVNGIKIKYEEKSIKIRNTKTFIHPTIIGKKEWFMKNPYDVKANRIEDAELWLRTVNKSVFKVYDMPLLYYRDFGENYYKKYFNALKSMPYLIKKNNYSIILILNAFKLFFIGLSLYVFNVFNKENIIISKRTKKNVK